MLAGTRSRAFFRGRAEPEDELMAGFGFESGKIEPPCEIIDVEKRYS